MSERAADLLAWLSSHLPRERDAAIERYLRFPSPAPSCAPPGQHLIGYHPSGIAAIVRALAEVPVLTDDVLVDLGSGLGKVVFLAHLLAGATAHGIEIQPALVAAACGSAEALGIDVSFTQADARDANLDDGTVFFLYAPFTGPVLAHVLRRLRAIAERRAIVVCALGIGLDRDAQWLVARPGDSFWLTIYDGVGVDTAPRPRRSRARVGSLADRIAFER